MDIRKFFGGGGAVKKNDNASSKKSENGTSKKSGDADSRTLTKLKSDPPKGSDFKHNKEANKKDSNRKGKDENGNKHVTDSHKKEKSNTDDKSKSKKRKKSEEKQKPDLDEEVLIIDDDSIQETFEEKRKASGKGRDKSKTPKRDEKKKPDRGKKRKKQISSESEEEVHITDKESDDEVTGRRSKPKKKDKKKATTRILDSDSDEEPIPKRARKKKDRPILHIGGTGEEVVEEKPRKKTFLDSFLTSPSPQKSGSKPKFESKPEPKKEPKQIVNASDFFGTSAVHRSDRKVAASSKPGTETQDEIEDIEMHSDEDFEKTLEMIDDSSMTSVKQKPVKSEPEAIETKTTSSSLSSKLAEKIKQKSDTPEKKSSVFVADTPIQKKPSPSKPSPTKPSPKRAKMEFVPSRADKKSPNKPSPSKTEEKTKPAAEKKPSPVKTEGSTAEGETPKHKGAGYRSYLNRAGPQSLGSKEIPEGAENCLEGLTFVITGVLESFERDESKSMIERYGGKVTGNVSKKTDYVVLGRDPGQSKVAKAEQFKTKQIDEDQLLDLIRTKPGKKSKYTLQAEDSIRKEKLAEKTQSLTKKSSVQEPTPSGLKKGFSSTQTQDSQSEEGKIQTDQSECGGSLMWVDKYAPTSLKQVIGQTGEKSNAKKLFNWLKCWHSNQAKKIKPVTGGFFGRGGSEDGAGFKAALLSGPPGVGKTTTVTLVCKEAGFSFVELNASDTRNAKSLKEVVAQAVGNTSMVDFLGSGESDTHGRKHCLVMDEVDGMSGNQDRGGVQELVNIIKKSRVPIITMCNDRNHQKMRTLANHCFDLRFQRPRVEQIKGAMMSIAFKEGLNIPPPALNEIIIGANQDIRQIVHNMSMWTAANKSVTYDQAKADSNLAKKDIVMGQFDVCCKVFVGGEETRCMTINDKADLYFHGPFDVCRKVFVGGEETRRMSIIDKSDLFFHDYNIAPLFVQENYIHVNPFAAKGSMSKHLSLLARTADSLCDSDCIERRIRTSQNWSLLGQEAMFASVIPGEYMRGSVTQMITFPSWLGKNSTTGKTDRILQELKTHMRLKISGDKKSLNLDYLPYLRTSLTQPLVTREAEGVRDVINMMDDYDIVKDDFDNIMEVSKWPNSVDPLSKLSTQTKSAFTRTYNKETHKTPYAVGQLTKKKRGGGAAAMDDLDLLGEEGEETGGVEDEEEDKDDLELDAMIKKKAKKKADTKPKAPAKGKGKGPAKGKAPAKGKKK